jgi:hypothetical protein
MADPVTLSPNTHSAVQGVVRARHDLLAWEKNLATALADDVREKRLTADQADEVADEYEVEFKAPKGDAPDAVETTAEANEAQRLAQAKIAEAEAAKTAAPAHHPNQERENRERAEHERRVEQDEKAKAAQQSAKAKT